MAGTGHRVALVMPKSIDAVVAILAILKSGNTYVPLGDNWSVGRLDKIFADGEFSLSIADAFHDSPERSDLPVLDNARISPCHRLQLTIWHIFSTRPALLVRLKVFAYRTGRPGTFQAGREMNSL